MARTRYKKRTINNKMYFYYKIKDKATNKYKYLYGKTVKELEGKIENFNKKQSYNIKDTKEYFSDFFREWLYNVKFLNIKQSTQSLYDGIYNIHIKNSELSNIKVKDINISIFQRYYKHLINNGTTANTVKSIHKLIAPCIRYAYNNDLIIKDFSKAIELPKNKINSSYKKEVQPLTAEEQRIFENAIAGDEYEMLYKLALYSGLRQGELLALTWNDINFDKCYIDVNKTIVDIPNKTIAGRGKNEKVIQTPKTKSSIRIVNIPKSIITMLLEYKDKQAEILGPYQHLQRFKNLDLIFCSKYGNYLDGSKIRKRFKSVLIDNNIEPRKFHNLRHTYATRLFELGESPKTVQKLLGHSTLSITMDTYTHVLEDMKQKAVNKLDILFNKFN